MRKRLKMMILQRHRKFAPDFCSMTLIVIDRKLFLQMTDCTRNTVFLAGTGIPARHLCKPLHGIINLRVAPFTEHTVAGRAYEKNIHKSAYSTACRSYKVIVFIAFVIMSKQLLVFR